MRNLINRHKIIYYFITLGFVALLLFVWFHSPSSATQIEKGLESNNQVLGAIVDNRPIEHILKDMKKSDPIVYSLEE